MTFLPKAAIRIVVRKALEIEAIWKLLPNRIRCLDYIRIQRSVALTKRAEKFRTKLIRAGIVIDGPAKGMIYASSQSHGSALIPKLLGSYESELHQVLEQLLSRNYKTFVDIGFAEGYYLVGLGLRLPNAKKVGFDTSYDAHALCIKNAIANRMSLNELSLKKEWTLTLHRHLIEEPSLIIIDCEGFEKDIFGSLERDDLIKADWIIEIHEFISQGTKETILTALKGTHIVREIFASSTNKHQFVPKSVAIKLGDDEVISLLSEGRPEGQSWIIASRRTSELE